MRAEPTTILEPMIELEPAHWAPDDYSAHIGQESWPSFWAAALQHYNLTPAAPGNWCVRVRDLLACDAVLARLIELALLGCENDEFAEAVHPLAGGYALVSGAGPVLVWPSCCNNLSDLDSWRDAVSSANPCRLMIGHGTVTVRRDGPLLRIEVESESRGIDPILASAPFSGMGQAIAHASRVLHHLHSRLRLIAEPYVGAGRAACLADLLVGTASL